MTGSTRACVMAALPPRPAALTRGTSARRCGPPSNPRCDLQCPRVETERTRISCAQAKVSFAHPQDIHVS